MSEASYEALKSALESDLPEQVEIRVRRERRRRWSPADKLRIVQEAFAPGAVAKRVAERYEISTGLLFTWRREIMTPAGAGFMPVQVIGNVDKPPRPAPLYPGPRFHERLPACRPHSSGDAFPQNRRLHEPPTNRSYAPRTSPRSP
jgi:hypothetical protein